MLLNLGLTADAAAAHKNEFVDSHQEAQSSSINPISSVVSFAATPLLGLGSLYNRYKGVETPETPNKLRSDMSSSNIESLPSSDGEYSLVEPAITPGPSPGPSRFRQTHPKKQSTRPKTTYQLAHPAARPRHKRLKLRSKLLLQLQQASHTPRPLPVLDVLPSTVYLPRLARKFPTVFRGRNGLGPNDLVIVISESYDKENKHQGHDDADDEHQEVVATICQLRSEDALARGKTEIYFNDGQAWEATPLRNGSYEFVANTNHGQQIVRWVLRGNKSRRSSAPPDLSPQEDTKRFIFSMIDPSTRRHPVAATMTRNRLEVYDQYSMPSSLPKSPTSAMSVASDGSLADSLLEGSAITTDDRLRTLIIVTSIWVAFREGWSPNFSYDDTVSTPSPKAMRTPSSSKAAFPAPVDSENDDVHKSKDHVTFPSIPYSHTATERDLPRLATSGKLAKRSNSTSATFLRRSNRQDSPGTGGRLNRHSMLLSRAKDNHSASRSSFAQPEKDGLKTQKTSAIYARKLEPVSDLCPDKDRSARPAKSHENMSRGAEPPDPESGGVKSKRRHRLSAMFDFLKKKDAH